MARPNKDKVRINITIDRELNDILHRKGGNKSSLISSLLWKFLALEKNTSQDSILESPNTITSLTGFEPATYGLREYSDERMGTREWCKDKISLKRVYKTNKNKYKDELYETKSTLYANSVLKSLNSLFNRKEIEVSTIKESILNSKYSSKYTSVAFRNFLNYCEANDLLELDLILKYRSKVKINFKSNIDCYVPIKKDINKSLHVINSRHSEFEVLFLIMLESGCRFTELKEFILKFEEKNIEVWDEKIVVYRNFYIRGTKSSFYLFFTYKTYKRLLKEILNIDLYLIDRLQNYASHSKEVLSLKYLRKYQFTLMIVKGVDFEIANFIQGRASQNIGFNHYLAKKTISIQQYKKIIKEF